MNIKWWPPFCLSGIGIFLLWSGSWVGALVCFGITWYLVKKLLGEKK